MALAKCQSLEDFQAADDGRVAIVATSPLSGFRIGRRGEIRQVKLQGDPKSLNTSVPKVRIIAVARGRWLIAWPEDIREDAAQVLVRSMFVDESDEASDVRLSHLDWSWGWPIIREIDGTRWQTRDKTTKMAALASDGKTASLLIVAEGAVGPTFRLVRLD